MYVSIQRCLFYELLLLNFGSLEKFLQNVALQESTGSIAILFEVGLMLQLKTNKQRKTETHTHTHGNNITYFSLMC